MISCGYLFTLAIRRITTIPTTTTDSLPFAATFITTHIRTTIITITIARTTFTVR